MEYVVLAERDLLVNDPFPVPLQNSGPETFTNPSGTRTINVPQVYIEADYQLYQNKGSVSNTVNYLTGVFNNSATIYANDGITVENSEIFVWTSDDPTQKALHLQLCLPSSPIAPFLMAMLPICVPWMPAVLVAWLLLLTDCATAINTVIQILMPLTQIFLPIHGLSWYSPMNSDIFWLAPYTMVWLARRCY